MNKFLIIVFFYIFNLSVYSQDTQHDQFDIVGEWAIIGGKYEINYIFSEDGYFSHRYKNKLLGGKNHLMNGGKYPGKYTNWKYELIKKNEFIDFIFIFYIEQEELLRQIGKFKIINNDELLLIYDLKNELEAYDFSDDNKKNIFSAKRLK